MRQRFFHRSGTTPCWTTESLPRLQLPLAIVFSLAIVTVFTTAITPAAAQHDKNTQTVSASSDADQDRAALIELVDRLKNDNEQLTAALSQQDKMAEELKKAQDSASELRTQLGQAQSDSEQLRTQLDTAHGDGKALNTQLRISKADSEMLRDEADQALLQIAALEQQLDVQQTQLSEGERRTGALLNRVNQLQQAQQVALNERDKSHSAAQRYRTMLGTARTNTDAVRDDLGSQLTAAQSELAKAQAKLQQSQDASRQFREMLTAEIGKRRSAEQQLTDMSNQEYVVKNGDSLSRIAQAFYGDAERWQSILEANNRQLRDNPNRLRPGMKLTIPPR